MIAMKKLYFLLPLIFFSFTALADLKGVIQNPDAVLSSGNFVAGHCLEFQNNGNGGAIVVDTGAACGSGGGGGSPGGGLYDVQSNNPLGTFFGDGNYTYVPAGSSSPPSGLTMALHSAFGNLAVIDTFAAPFAPLFTTPSEMGFGFQDQPTNVDAIFSSGGSMIGAFFGTNIVSTSASDFSGGQGINGGGFLVSIDATTNSKLAGANGTFNAVVDNTTGNINVGNLVGALYIVEQNGNSVVPDGQGGSFSIQQIGTGDIQNFTAGQFTTFGQGGTMEAGIGAASILIGDGSVISGYDAFRSAIFMESASGSDFTGVNIDLALVGGTVNNFTGYVLNDLTPYVNAGTLTGTVYTLDFQGGTALMQAGQAGVGNFTPLELQADTGGNQTAPLLQFLDSSGSNSVGVTISPTPSSWVMQLPDNAGSSGDVLQTDGTGITSWVATATGTITSITAGTGLNGGTITTSGTISSNAAQTLSFQPGLLTTTVTTGKAGFVKVSNASTVDNMIASAASLTTCTTNPTVTFYECGTSTTCASPTTIASVQVTAADTATPATISSSAITAGDYVAWAVSAGACASINIAGTAQIHSN